MNPLAWEDTIQRLQRRLDPNHQTVNNRMENPSGADNDWATYCQYSRYTVDEPQSRMGVNLGLDGPPSHSFYIKESEVKDPDGEPFAMDEEDPELTRKRKELREIEEKIMRKKVAIALKKVEPIVKETVPPGFSCNKQSATCESTTLKERVNVILQQRHPVSFLSKVQSPKDRMNSSSLSKDGLVQEDHPLKLRVKALMKQRSSDPCVLPTDREAPALAPPPPSRSVTSPAKEENSINQGFQRFLSVLNKGVDMDLLNRIVNDDGEDLPSLGGELLNSQLPAVENKSDLPFRSQRSNSGTSLLGYSGTSSGEGKTDVPSQVRSLNERLSIPDDDDEKKNDKGDLCYGSCSQTKSPLAVKKKKEEEEKPKVDDQHVQLQNILKTLGLSLEAEEMNKLADRTQQRLYGKKHEGMRADCRGEQKSWQRDSHRQHRKSSSSSRSTSSSQSTSRSCSPSPSRRRRSGTHSTDSKQRRSSERGRSRDRSRGGSTCRDSSTEAQRHRDRDRDRDRDKHGKDSKETSTYQHPYSLNQMYPPPHPAAFSAFPQYSLSQYSQYNAYHSGTYSAATNSYWTYAQGTIPTPLYSSGHPHQQNTSLHFPDSVASPDTVYSHHNDLKDINLLVNPDLSQSEGQFGLTSGSRCLQVISTKQPPTSCLKQLTKSRKRRRGNIEAHKKRLKLRRKKRKLEAERARMSAQCAAKLEAQQRARVFEDTSEAELSEEEKQLPTEEEIKANLRKRLEAFNQMVKQRFNQPANSQTPQTG